MKTICFYFQIHQPYRLKRYRFFNIGSDHYYYDDFANEDLIQNIANSSFNPANRVLLDMVKEHKGKFKFAISVSGTALDQLEMFAPEVIDGLRRLADTGCVEFLAETYAHSLASLTDQVEFQEQVKAHANRIESLFGQKPKVFRNSELIYSDEIGSMVHEMGFSGMLTTGAKHVLGWKSPNYLYAGAEPNLKLLLRNEGLSEAISTHFSDYNWNEYPLTAEKLLGWVEATPKDEKVVNLFMNYEVLGNFHKASSGIFKFMEALPRMAKDRKITFSTPSEVMENQKVVDHIYTPEPISWIGEEKDTSVWMGNILQQEAANKLYGIGERVRMSRSRALKQDWWYLQSSDHFYYMGTKTALPFSPYASPYEAFNTYMNVLSDFEERVYAEYPKSIDNEELHSLLQTIHNQALEIEKLTAEVDALSTKKTVKSVAKPKKVEEEKPAKPAEKKSKATKDKAEAKPKAASKTKK